MYKEYEQMTLMDTIDTKSKMIRGLNQMLAYFEGDNIDFKG